MRSTLLRRWVAIALCVGSGPGAAFAAGNEVAARSAIAGMESASKTASDSAPPAAKLFAGQQAWRGTLGDMPMQATLRLKADFEGGLDGEYFLFGHSQKILLAGEFDDDGIFLEESENGTDVSGQWEGKLEQDMLRGSWTSADGAVTKPFMLKAVRKQSNTPRSKSGVRISGTVDNALAPNAANRKP